MRTDYSMSVRNDKLPAWISLYIASNNNKSLVFFSEGSALYFLSFFSTALPKQTMKKFTVNIFLSEVVEGEALM